MTMSREPIQPTPGISDELDARVEALLDELVASAPTPELPADFTARVLSRRPFAPWEVRHARVWRLPFGIGLGLVGASAVVFLAPLWRLGPGTAIELWAKLTAAALASPLRAAFAAGPLLAEAAGSVSSQLAGGAIALLAAGAALAGGALAFGLRVPARQGAGRAPAR